MNQMNNKITIYRGSHQIGGCATEIKTGGHRIIIDVGANLPGSKSDNVITYEELIDIVFRGKGSLDAFIWGRESGLVEERFLWRHIIR